MPPAGRRRIIRETIEFERILQATPSEWLFLSHYRDRNDQTSLFMALREDSTVSVKKPRPPLIISSKNRVISLF